MSGIRVVSQPFCMDQMNPARLIFVHATLPIKSPACSSLQDQDRRIGELGREMTWRVIPSLARSRATSFSPQLPNPPVLQASRQQAELSIVEMASSKK